MTFHFCVGTNSTIWVLIKGIHHIPVGVEVGLSDIVKVHVVWFCKNDKMLKIGVPFL